MKPIAQAPPLAPRPSHPSPPLTVVDAFEEFFSPVTAAHGLLHSAVAKRKQVLPKTMAFIMHVLTSSELQPRQKAGALHFVGAIADILLQVRRRAATSDAFGGGGGGSASYSVERYDVMFGKR